MTSELVTAREACERLGPDVTPDMVRDWVRRGLLRPAATAPGRPSLFRLPEVVEAEHRTRNATTGRPRSASSELTESRMDVTISRQVTAVEAAQVQLARRRCTVVKRSGKDCDTFVPDTSPITVCRDHMREAFLWYSDYLAGDYDPSSAQRPGHADEPILRTSCVKGSRREGQVYYLAFADRIKIGYSVSLRDRLGVVPFDEVLAVEPGPQDLEAVRHKQFASCRIVREWFGRSEELLSHIDMLRAHYGKPDPQTGVLALDA